MKKGAHFSVDRVYRYLLWRVWDERKGIICFIGLNPSTANEQTDDNTIRRLVHFTEQGGFGGFCIVNLFSFRARDFDDVKSSDFPIGKKTNSYIKRYATKANLVCLMWGGKGPYMNRDKDVLKMLKDLKIDPFLVCLGETKKGNPKHPLYLRNETPMRDFHGRAN